METKAVFFQQIWTAYKGDLVRPKQLSQHMPKWTARRQLADSLGNKHCVAPTILEGQYGDSPTKTTAGRQLQKKNDDPPKRAKVHQLAVTSRPMKKSFSNDLGKFKEQNQLPKLFNQAETAGQSCDFSGFPTNTFLHWILLCEGTDDGHVSPVVTFVTRSAFISFF